jgi:hypothetical protein
MLKVSRGRIENPAVSVFLTVPRSRVPGFSVQRFRVVYCPTYFVGLLDLWDLTGPAPMLVPMQIGMLLIGELPVRQPRLHSPESNINGYLRLGTKKEQQESWDT